MERRPLQTHFGDTALGLLAANYDKHEIGSRQTLLKARRRGYGWPWTSAVSRCGPLLRLSETLCEGDRFEHRFGFVDGLLMFAFRSRIVDPTAAGLNVCLSVFE